MAWRRGRRTGKRVKNKQEFKHQETELKDKFKAGHLGGKMSQWHPGNTQQEKFQKKKIETYKNEKRDRSADGKI